MILFVILTRDENRSIFINPGYNYSIARKNNRYQEKSEVLKLYWVARRVSSRKAEIFIDIVEMLCQTGFRRRSGLSGLFSNLDDFLRILHSLLSIRSSFKKCGSKIFLVLVQFFLCLLDLEACSSCRFL